MSANVERLIAEHKGGEVGLVGLLQDVQLAEGYLPREALELISRQLSVPISQLYGLATFYRSFTLTPRGKHTVTCCMGTACHVRGAAQVVRSMERALGIRSGDTTKDLQFTLETVNCVGCCALAPVVIVDGEYHGNVTAARTDALLRRHMRRGSGP